MQYQILGLQQLDFTDKTTGQVIDGVKLHLASKKKSDYIIGFSVSTQFIPTKRFQSVIAGIPLDSLVNRVLDFQFNDKGKIDDFELLPIK